MIKLAIIGASYLQWPLVDKAKQMGIYTICFAWDKDAVCKNIADKFYPISIVDKESIFSICKEERIDGICTIASDIAAPTVAYVAEHLGLVGNSYHAACIAHNKYLMREALRSAGVLCPEYYLVTNIEDVGKISFKAPMIVKPTDRSGSLGVRRVDHIEDLYNSVKIAMNYSFAQEVIVEQYIEGREISVEFISFDGRHYPLQITDKVTTGAPFFVELEHHQPADLTSEQFGRIYQTTKVALDALGIKNGASHSEFRITADGSLFIMEIGARMGGDFIGSDLVELSTGYDFLRGVIEVSLGEFTEPVIVRRSHSGVCFLSKLTYYLKDVIEAKESYPEIVRAEITDPGLHELTCSADRSGYLIYFGDRKFTYEY